MSELFEHNCTAADQMIIWLVKKIFISSYVYVHYHLIRVLWGLAAHVVPVAALYTACQGLKHCTTKDFKGECHAMYSGVIISF